MLPYEIRHSSNNIGISHNWWTFPSDVSRDIAVYGIYCKKFSSVKDWVTELNSNMLLKHLLKIIQTYGCIINCSGLKSKTSIAVKEKEKKPPYWGNLNNSSRSGCSQWRYSKWSLVKLQKSTNKQRKFKQTETTHANYRQWSIYPQL